MGRYQSCQKQVNDKILLIFTTLCPTKSKTASGSEAEIDSTKASSFDAATSTPEQVSVAQ